MSALAAESWTWYAVSWAVVAARMSSRTALLGSFKKLQIDDALMVLSMITDTVLIVGMNIISVTGSNLIDPNDHTPLTPEKISELEYGSKWVLVVEQMQILTVWLAKACLLIMYGRLTMSLKQNIAVKIVAVYVAASFILMEILYLGVWCRPFNQYWAVPPENTQCSAATHHLITNAALNISSDVMIILIPMPVFLQSHLPLKKKAILCAVFGLGSFTILSAILNKYYSFNQPFASEWTFWYIRESSTALITANLPLTWTLLRRVFNLKSFNGKSSQQPTSERGSRYPHSTAPRRTHTSRTDDLEFDPADSQEQINRTYAMPLKIYQQREVRFTTHTVQGDDESTQVVPQNLKGETETRIVGKRSEDASSEESVHGVVTVCKGV